MYLIVFILIIENSLKACDTLKMMNIDLSENNNMECKKPLSEKNDGSHSDLVTINSECQKSETFTNDVISNVIIDTEMDTNAIEESNLNKPSIAKDCTLMNEKWNGGADMDGMDIEFADEDFLKAESNVMNPRKGFYSDNSDPEIDEEDFHLTESEGSLLDHHFTDEGILVDKNGKKFEFNVYNDKKRNQQRYEVLGEKITEYIYDQLENRCKLKKIFINNDSSNQSNSGFFFASEGSLDTKDKLLILIHGSGVVRAGQWARSVIINDNLYIGSQIPYIERAIQEGYEVVVLNTNYNSGRGNFSKKISSPEDHANWVWKNYVEKSSAKRIGIVAHSYGGVVVTSLIKNFYDAFRKKVFAIAFTDSVHYSNNSQVNKFLGKRACNWVTSNDPIDTPVHSFSRNDAKLVSAGDTRHEWTSGKSIASVFRYLTEMLEQENNISGSEENGIWSYFLSFFYKYIYN